MLKCEYCGTPRHKGEIRCPACGAYYPDEERSHEMTVRDLARFYDVAARACRAGNPSANDARGVNDPRVKKLTDAVLYFVVTLLFGIVGVHRFMKGKIVSGIFWVCTAGVFGFGYIYDLAFAFGTLIFAGVRFSAERRNDETEIKK